MRKKLGIANAILFAVSIVMLSKINWCATNYPDCHVHVGLTEYMIFLVPIFALMGVVVSMVPRIWRPFSTVLMVFPLAWGFLIVALYIFLIIGLSS